MKTFTGQNGSQAEAGNASNAASTATNTTTGNTGGAILNAERVTANRAEGGSLSAEAQREGNTAKNGTASAAASAQNNTGNGTASMQYTRESYSFQLPDDLPLAPAVMNDFTEFCSESGLSPTQAQKAVDFYLGQVRKENGRSREACECALRNGVFAQGFNEQIAAARRATRELDARMNGRLMPLVEAGLGNSPEFVELMAHLGGMMSEESLNTSALAHGGAQEMSIEDFLRQEVFKNK